jgi:hypothetical protein
MAPFCRTTLPQSRFLPDGKVYISRGIRLPRAELAGWHL